MILVDTSVFIDFLRGADNRPVDRLNDIIEKNIPFGINNYIYQELLQGAASEKDFNSLKEYLGTQRFYGLLKGQESHENAARLYFRCRRQGLTIRSTIDLIISQIAIENNLFLLHNDKDFEEISKIKKNLKIY